MESASAVVLLSSGLDSSFNLFKARQKFSVRLALTFNYGQKAAAAEIRQSAWLAASLKIPHQVIELPWFKAFTKTALVGAEALPFGKEVKIDDLDQSMKTAKSVWVPNRNGILLNIAAGFAEGLGATFVVPGFNIEEAATFPDNSQPFLEALDHSFLFSTEGRVKTHCFSTAMNKIEIVREGKELGMPFGRLWPCYLDGSQNGGLWCGVCESCQRYRRAIESNGLVYSTLQEKPA